MKIEEVKKAHCTPVDDPYYPEPPYEYKNTENLVVVYETYKEQIEAVLPEPLKPAGNNRASACFMNFPDVSGLGPYHASAIFLEVEFDGEPGAYCPYLYMDSYAPIVCGREIWGHPKKNADISLMHLNDTMVGRISRNSVEAAVATLPYKYDHSSIEELEEEMAPSPLYNLKVIPSVEGGTPAVLQLTSVVSEDVTIWDCWKGPATLELRPNVHLPMYRIGVKKLLGGYYFRKDSKLPYGKVVYDYLNP